MEQQQREWSLHFECFQCAVECGGVSGIACTCVMTRIVSQSGWDQDNSYKDDLILEWSPFHHVLIRGQAYRVFFRFAQNAPT